MLENWVQHRFQVSVFVCPHENEAFLKVSVFKSLHFQSGFRKSPFLVETIPSTHRLDVDRRLKRIKKVAVFLRKRVRTDGPKSNDLKDLKNNRPLKN